MPGDNIPESMGEDFSESVGENISEQAGAIISESVGGFPRKQHPPRWSGVGHHAQLWRHGNLATHEAVSPPLTANRLRIGYLYHWGRF
jgi:hypothetical protein